MLTREMKLEKQRLAQKRYRERHPDKIKEQNKKSQAYRNAYYWRNRDKIRASRKEYDKIYNLKHREEKRLKNKWRYWLNRSAELLRRKQHKALLKYEVLAHYSYPSQTPECAICHIDDIDVLCIDHINDDGYLTPRNANSRKDIHHWLKVNNYPAGFQVLCANCNLKKSLKHLREVCSETGKTLD